jgi:hypothetical protein
VQSALQSETVRGIIADHYDDIIHDEKMQIRENNKTPALKIQTGQGNDFKVSKTKREK